MRNFVVRGSNFVYVAHSGILNKEFKFNVMGMTEEAYREANLSGNYRVSCICETSLEVTLANIEEDFNQPVEYRYLDSSITKEESIQCAKEYYEEVLPTISKNSYKEYCIVFKESNPTEVILLDLPKVFNIDMKALEHGNPTRLQLSRCILDDFSIGETMREDLGHLWGRKLSEYIVVRVVQSIENTYIHYGVLVPEDELRFKIDSLLQAESEGCLELSQDLIVV